MTPRVVHIGFSLALVVAAYWTYALLAVPLIEPAADPRGPDPPLALPASPAVNPVYKELHGLFPPDSWELQQPEVLESDQAKLLFQRYENRGDGWVELRPLAMLFLPDEPAADPVERARRSIILEVPDGAELRFDKTFNPSQLKIGRLLEGKLRGQVTIRSQGNLPGPEDDLSVVTRDVELSETRVWTSQTVDFRWGPHYGRGRQMEIKLLPRDGPQRDKGAGPNIGGIEQLEFQTVERLHLDLESLSKAKKPAASAVAPAQTAASPLVPAAAPAQTASRGGAGAGPPAVPAMLPLPIEVTCRGKFQFNLVQRVAIFQDQVNLLRIHPSGPSDQLSCETLSIFFVQAVRAAGPAESAKPRASATDLQPQRIEARGTPATVSAPTDKLSARGERLDYDLTTGAILLEGTQEVELQQGPNEIHARNIRYQPAGPGRLGQGLAKGPGFLRGRMADRPGQSFEARWVNDLQIRPQEGNQVISLTGGAGLKYEGTGELSAEEIHFWLLELPQTNPSDPSRLQPDRMLARGKVRLDSPQLSSTVDRLEIWFAMAPPSPTAGKPAAARPPASPVAASPSPPDPAAPPPRQQHFEILGRLFQARVLLHDRQQHPDLLALTVEGSVRFAETQTAQPNEQPMLITGDRLDVADSQGPTTTATVVGNPAHLEARGLSLTGPNLRLDRGTNRVVVDGPGRMQVPIDRDMDGRPLAKPAPLDVDWQRKMESDGRTVRFEDWVTATSASQQMKTQVLEVRFQRPIALAGPRPEQPPQVEQILARGGVFLESRAIEAGVLTAHHRMQLGDVAVHLGSGALTGSGPGWLISVRRGSADPLRAAILPVAAPRAGTAPNRPAPPAAPAPLSCLHLRFLGPLTGNVHQREMAFHERVRAAFAPVDSWLATLDSDNPEVLGPQAAVLHSDHLSLCDMSPASSTSRSVEASADGNVVIEGNTVSPQGERINYTGRANRMTYSQGKDQLILEGNGRTDAELFREQHVGSIPSRVAAQKFIYYPRKNQVDAEGFRSLQLNQFPNGEWKKGAKLPAILSPRP